MGKGVVASPQALAGLKHREDAPVLTAASPEAWVEQVLRLFDSEALRREFGTQARRFVERHHDWDSCLSPFGALLGIDGETAEPDPAALDMN